MPDRFVGDRFKLVKQVHAGDKTRGIPELWEAQDGGDFYYVKLWKRNSKEQGEIQALWNREVRGLMRLQGYPGAHQLFVTLRDLGSSDDTFYAVIDGGRRVPLSEVLKKRSQYSWLSGLYEVGRRRPIWEGLLRIAQGVALLHAEGTLHRSLVPASIFVNPDGLGEFRLSGFEWSLRVSGSEGAVAAVAHRYAIKAPELDDGRGEYSPGTDWFDFGAMAAELFGADIKNAKKRATARAAVQRLNNLREKERELLLLLIEEDSEKRLSSSDAITHSIKEIIRDLNAVSVGAGRDLVLAVRFAPDLDLPKIIEGASMGAAPTSDPRAQRDWIQKDLAGDVRVTARVNPYQHFVIKGKFLEYRVKPWSISGTPSWEVGFCESAEIGPKSNSDDQHYSIGNRRIDVQLYPQVRQNFKTVKDRSARWDGVFQFRENANKLPAHLKDVHDFFRVTQQLDTLLTVAQICPVRVVSTTKDLANTFLEITPLEEAERSDLARQLGLQSPSEQMQDWFDLGAEEIVADDDEPKKNRYSFLDRRTISSEGTLLQWSFLGASPHIDGPRYRFRAVGSVNIKPKRLYLARNHDGTLAQIRRRHRAIEGLRFHETLLKAIADPLSAMKKTQGKLPAAKANIPLDESKLSAISNIWHTQPMYAVQGPPGTGKTTLIKAFTDRIFSNDHSSQLLITAHSHHTVDDVRLKLSKMFDEEPGRPKPIIVRLGARVSTEHNIEPVTQKLVERLFSSRLGQSAPPFLKTRLNDASTAAGSEGSDGAVDLRTMQILVQDAANLTFATSNSAELSELSERGRRFDWSVIEEAGKAHGFDMAGAMQESHRLLLIGDHHQLPPFNARLYRDLLGEPLRVQKAIITGAQFAPGLVDLTLVEEEEGRENFVQKCDLWRSMVTLFGQIFDRSTTDNKSDSAAATLTDQHRMHPHIANLVGGVFYPDQQGGTILKSPMETVEKFQTAPPYLIGQQWLTDKRIVWCDVPWIQKKEYAEGEVDGLFVSEPEANRVVEVLEAISKRDSHACEIQILSPYNNQLEAIKRKIDQAYQDGRIRNVFSSPFNIHLDKRMGATVDEFQGGEADIIIVSLVRNNALVPWKSVGFLKESNRMNVLLSRARQKLIVVGSWDFFDTRCDDFTTQDDEHSYIGEMMKRMKQALAAGNLAKV